MAYLAKSTFFGIFDPKWHFSEILLFNKFQNLKIYNLSQNDPCKNHLRKL